MVAAPELITPTLGQPPIENAPKIDGDLELHSVTTVIGVLDKRSLTYWSAEEAAIAALHQQATWRGMLEDDDPACDHRDAKRCPVVKWIRDARFRKPKGQRSATERGTVIHAACEEYALTGVRPEVDDEIRPYLDQFDGWLQRFTPTYHVTEVTVYNPRFGYAGTLDTILSIGGHGAPTLPGTDAVKFMGDYKSTDDPTDSDGNPSTPWPSENALQLAAYRHATHAAVWRPRRRENFRRRYYLLSEAELAMAQPVPEVDTGLVILITPESCEAFPMVCDADVFEAYLAVQDAARWAFYDSRNVMSPPLVAPAGGRF